MIKVAIKYFKQAQAISKRNNLAMNNVNQIQPSIPISEAKEQKILPIKNLNLQNLKNQQQINNNLNHQTIELEEQKEEKEKILNLSSNDNSKKRT